MDLQSAGLHIKQAGTSSSNTVTIRGLSFYTEEYYPGPAIEVEWPDRRVEDRSPTIKCVLEDIEIGPRESGVRDNEDYVWKYGFVTSVPWGLRMNSVTFQLCYKAIKFIDSSSKHYLSDITIHSCKIGFEAGDIEGATTEEYRYSFEGVHLSNFEFSRVELGINIVKGTIVNISNGHIDANGDMLMRFHALGEVSVSNVGCFFRSNKNTNMVGIENSSNVVISNCSFYRHEASVEPVTITNVFHVNGEPSTGIRLSDNNMTTHGTGAHLVGEKKHLVICRPESDYR